MARTNKLSPGMRKALLAIHILFAGIMLGGTVAFVVLDIAALGTDSEAMLESCYRIMRLLSHTSLRASTIGAVLSGIVLSALTPWGFFRFRWIVAKEALSLLALLLGVYGIYRWSLEGLDRIAAEGIRAANDPAYVANGTKLGIGLVLQLISLVVMFLLSVYKPWGARGGKGTNRNGRG